MIGRTLSHYRIEERLGAGGMGVVYRARDQRLERDVALKFLPEGLLADEAARHRFHREAVALSRLNDPGIAAVYDFDTCEGRDFLVMEYVPGRTLAAVLEPGALPEERVRDLGGQIAAALVEAHHQGIVHRDLKPGNIIVTPGGRTKVLDFGLAKLRPVGEPSQAETMTETVGVVGTLPYMSPEQLRGQTVDARSDIYALGAVLYEMATGRRAFEQRQTALLTEAILHAAVTPPRAVNPALSHDLQAVILRCLEKKPAARFQTADEVWATPGAAVGAAGVLARHKVAATFGGLALVALGVIAYTLVQGRNPSPPPSPAPTTVADSLAVLPFENAGGNPEMEYLSDGITETLINNLSQLPRLRVIARNTAFLYKGRNPDVRQVGKELGVRAVLTGRVQRHGDALLIRVELAETAQGWRLWGDQYDRAMADIFAVQEAVAREITGHLRLSLTGDDEKRLAKRHTRNPEAYQLYLKGRYYLDNKRGEASIQAGLDAFRKAIDLDPTYALAYAGLAHAYYEQSSITLPPDEAMPKVRAAAKRALEIDPDLAQAHATLALVTAQYDWDWEAAKAAYRKALSLNPGDALTWRWYAFVFLDTGDLRGALASFEKARDLDPLSFQSAVQSVLPLINAPPGQRRLDRALVDLQKIVAANPDSGYARLLMGQVLDYLGRHAEAIAALEKAAGTREFPGLSDASLAHAYAASGRADDARRMLAALVDLTKRQYVSSVLLAEAQAALGEYDAAFESLEQAYEARDEELLLIMGDPRLDPLRADPRFNDLLRRMGLSSQAVDRGSLSRSPAIPWTPRLQCFASSTILASAIVATENFIRVEGDTETSVFVGAAYDRARENEPDPLTSHATGDRPGREQTLPSRANRDHPGCGNSNLRSMWASRRSMVRTKPSSNV